MSESNAVPIAARWPRSVYLVAAVALLAGAAGCQTAAPVTNRRLIEHQAMIDFSGLKPAEPVEAIKASCSIPHQWEALPTKKTALYTHQQWKSPSTHTGIGVVYIRLPLPLSERTLLWFAKREYTKASDDGKLIGQWTDDIGREWFEAQNNKYHVRGFAIVRGFNAWVAYFGSKTGYPPDVAELGVAARAVETFLPDPRRPQRKPVDTSDDDAPGASIAAGTAAGSKKSSEN
jgi:hypothetical protein